MPDAATPSEPLDTTLVLVSPENIAFQFRLAGPALRAVAFLLDLLAMAAVAFGILWVLVLTGVLGVFMGPFLVALFFLVWGWGAALEVFNNGQTPGKAAVGLRVVSHNGLSINVAQAVLRNLLRAIDVAPPFFPGVLVMAATRRFQRLGDLAAGTVVVIDRPVREPRPPRLPARDEAARLVPATFAPPPALAEALAAYAGRRAALPPARRTELAALAAEPLCVAWGVPAPRDADALICAVYERSIDSAAGDRA